MAKAAGNYKWHQSDGEYFYYFATTGRIVGSVSPFTGSATKAVLFAAHLVTGDCIGRFVGLEFAQQAVAVAVASDALAPTKRAPKR